MPPPLAHEVANFAAEFIYNKPIGVNTIGSPLSAASLVAMILPGCGRDDLEFFLRMTKERTSLYDRADVIRMLINGVQVLEDELSVQERFPFIYSCLKTIEGVNFNMANNIYLELEANLKFKDYVEEVFGSSLAQIDFKDQQASTDIINDWVSRQTNNVIRNMQSPENFDVKACMLFINATNFKGNWLTPFSKKATKQRKFHLNKTVTVEVPQMFQRRAFVKYGTSARYSDRKSASLLGLYCQGTQSCMVIVLPDLIDGLDNLVERFAKGDDLMGEIMAMDWTKMDVRLPRFKAEVTIDVKKLMLKQGLDRIFNKERSYVDLLTCSTQLVAAETFQKASIEVDEDGAEAAAATCLIMRKRKLSRALPGQQLPSHARTRPSWIYQFPEPFVVDRPFLFLLLVHDIPVFAGTYRGPHDISGIS